MGQLIFRCKFVKQISIGRKNSVGNLGFSCSDNIQYSYICYFSNSLVLFLLQLYANCVILPSISNVDDKTIEEDVASLSVADSATTLAEAGTISKK